jgi:methyl-accepting chemotaxis protein
MSRVIKGRLIAHTLVAIIVMAILSLVSIVSTGSEILSGTLSKSTKIMSQLIDEKLSTQISNISIVSMDTKLSDMNPSKSNKVVVLDRYKKHFGFSDLILTDKEGEVIGYKYSVKDKEFFTKAMEGHTFITTSLQRKNNGSANFVIAAPMYKGANVETNEIIGVLIATLPLDYFIDLMNSMKLDEDSTAYIIDNEGSVVMHNDEEKILSGFNAIKELENDKSLKKQALLEHKMISGEEGQGVAKINKRSQLVSYYPLTINDWSIAITVPVGVFMNAIYVMFIIGAMITFMLIVVGILSAKQVVEDSIEPITKCSEILKELTKGNLDIEIPSVNTKTVESLELYNSALELQKTNNKIINDTASILGAISNKDLTIGSEIGKTSYTGSYENIYLSMKQLKVSMTEFVKLITESFRSIETGSKQLSDASADIAEGSTLQSVSIRDIIKLSVDINNLLDTNASTTEKISSDVKELSLMAEKCGESMDKLLHQFNELDSTAKNINQIITDIEDISQQTNLLSLNATIEAARAGEAGHGFAVVASSVGVLANQSRESALKTGELINETNSAIDRGSEYAKVVQNELQDMILKLNNIVSEILSLNTASISQQEEFVSMKKAIDDISGVVHNNSALAEETSATSEELFSQAKSLSLLVDTFKLPQ